MRVLGYLDSVLRFSAYSVVLRVYVGFVDVAPQPIFSWLKGLDDGMGGCIEMLLGVLIFRAVAAANVSTGFAESEVNPTVA